MGTYLSQPATEKESSSGTAKGHDWGVSAMQGWRNNMEDSHITLSSLGEGLEGFSLFAVFDGHGGREVAAFCQDRVPEVVRRQLRQAQQASELQGQVLGQALTTCFHSIDDMLRSPEHERALLGMKQAPGRSGGTSASGGSEGEPPKSKVLSMLQSSIQADLAQARDKGSLTREEATQVMMKMALSRRLETQNMQESSDGGAADNVGCTAVCILLSEKEVVCANAGDSRAVLCRKGQAVPLSYDHKPNDEQEKSRIEAAGGRVEEINVGVRVHYRVNGNLNLSRAIGDLEYKKRHDLGPEKQIICSTPDIIVMPLTEDDEFVLLACDGVWDVKTNQQACDFVRERLRAGQEIPKIIEELLDDCLATDPRETNGLGGDNMTCVIVRLRRTQA